MPRPEHPQAHGGLDLQLLRQHGIAPSDILDLSTNLSPYAPHPDVLRAIAGADVNAYPDPEGHGAKLAISRALDVDPRRIMLGHGAVELLWLAVAALAGGPGPLLIASPTFSEPEHAARAWGIPVAHVHANAAKGFALEAEDIARAIGFCCPGVVYLCRPNNPTGSAVEWNALHALMAAHPEVLFILDEAFLGLSVLHKDAARAVTDNVLRVRSLTKEHGIAGVRMGYALGAPEIIARLEAHRPPWTVSTAAQAAIEVAIGLKDYVREVREQLLHAKSELVHALSGLGLTPVESATHFLWVPVADTEALRMRLLTEHKVLVRGGASFGYSDYLRLPGCVPDARGRLISALRAELTP